MLNLYFVNGSVSDTPGENDLLVRANSAYKAAQFWRTHWGTSVNPNKVWLVPVIGKKGAIDWNQMIGQDFHDPNDQ